MLAILPVIAFAITALAAPAPDSPVLGVTIGSPEPPAATPTGAVPNPAQVTINSITYGGSGCPQGSVGSFISADRLTSVNYLQSFFNRSRASELIFLQLHTYLR
jgi:hypothetical protein